MAKRKHVVTSTSSNGVAAILNAMRTEVTALLEVADGNAKPVSRLLRLLDHVDAELQHGPGGFHSWLPASTKDPEPSRRQPPAHQKSRSYTIELRDGIEVLVEKWPGKDVDAFRCGRDVYDAVAEVIHTHGNGSATFPMLMDRVSNQLGRAPAAHHVRMCLRFWIAYNLLRRSKFCYFPRPDSRFTKMAGVAWRTLAANAGVTA